MFFFIFCFTYLFFHSFLLGICECFNGFVAPYCTPVQHVTTQPTTTPHHSSSSDKEGDEKKYVIIGSIAGAVIIFSIIIGLVLKFRNKGNDDINRFAPINDDEIN